MIAANQPQQSKDDQAQITRFHAQINTCFMGLVEIANTIVNFGDHTD